MAHGGAIARFVKFFDVSRGRNRFIGPLDVENVFRNPAIRTVYGTWRAIAGVVKFFDVSQQNPSQILML